MLSGDFVSSNMKSMLTGVLYKCSYKSLNYLITSEMPERTGNSKLEIQHSEDYNNDK